jgi:hypothetical protein
MPDILEYYLQISLNYGLIVVCTLHCGRTTSVLRANSGKELQHIFVSPKSFQIWAIYALQNLAYPPKHSGYTPKVPKSSLNILTSPEKDEKAVEMHSLNLHFQSFSGLFLLYSPLNPTSYDIS